MGKVGIILAISVLLAISSFTYFQYQTNEKLVHQQQSDIDMLAKMVKIDFRENMSLKHQNNQLIQQLAIVRDSIQWYKGKIKSLEGKLYRREKEIKSLKSELSNSQNRFFTLENEINQLKTKASSSQEQISVLEMEKNKLLSQSDSLYRAHHQQMELLKASKAEIVEYQTKQLKQEDIQSLIENTQVSLKNVLIRTAPNSKNLNKIKKNGKAWYYTEIHLDMNHPNTDLLLDEEFVLKIIDLDTNQPISYVEKNPIFPESDQNTEGVLFNYDTNTPILYFYNTEPKTSANYGIQLYYLHDGKEIELLTGFHQIIRDRKVRDVFEMKN